MGPECVGPPSPSLRGAIDGVVNPVKIERKENLFCVLSGASINALIQSDIHGAEETGKTAFQNFMQCRTFSKTIKLHAPLKKIQLEAFKLTANLLGCQEAKGNRRD